jgi:hypothetical protein
MTDITSRRRGHGEDAIYFDAAAKSRYYVGAISVSRLNQSACCLM